MKAGTCAVTAGSLSSRICVSSLYVLPQNWVAQSLIHSSFVLSYDCCCKTKVGGKKRLTVVSSGLVGVNNCSLHGGVSKLRLATFFVEFDRFREALAAHWFFALFIAGAAFAAAAAAVAVETTRRGGSFVYRSVCCVCRIVGKQSALLFLFVSRFPCSSCSFFFFPCFVASCSGCAESVSSTSLFVGLFFFSFSPKFLFL